VSIKLYVEGGGDSKTLKTACRKGFRQFIERAGLRNRMPRIVACGGRQNAYDSFKTACGIDEEEPILLVDSEAPVTNSAWEHLIGRDGWQRPNGANDHQCHLMIQVMESWFLADRAALASYYGQHFSPNSLPQNSNIEQVSKSDVFNGLKAATRNTQKRDYSKGSHSFEILAKLNPAAVESASPSAKRFLDALRAQSAPRGGTP
jgi:hypothetical protein